MNGLSSIVLERPSAGKDGRAAGRITPSPVDHEICVIPARRIDTLHRLAGFTYRRFPRIRLRVPTPDADPSPCVGKNF